MIEYVWYFPQTDELYVASDLAHVIFSVMKAPDDPSIYLGVL